MCNLRTPFAHRVQTPLNILALLRLGKDLTPLRSTTLSRCALVAMPGPRFARVGGGGGRPASRGILVGNGDETVNVAAGGGEAAGGRSTKARKLARSRNEPSRGRMRYISEDEKAAIREIEKGLRLKRLEQVRQQSRQHAAAVREEYRYRREENKRAVLQESKVCASPDV